ncbi:hypothetical protein BGX29_002566, partial [Mortierella sp. GBA35]
MRFFSIVIIIASLLSIVFAQRVNPTAPTTSTIWNAGASVTVRWTLISPATTTSLKIELIGGQDPRTQKTIATLGTGVAGGTSLLVTLPANLKSDYYIVRIGDSYSDSFIIRGTGNFPTGPAPPPADGTMTAYSFTTSTTTTATTLLPVNPTTTSVASPKPTGNSADHTASPQIALNSQVRSEPVPEVKTLQEVAHQKSGTVQAELHAVQVGRFD